MVVIRISLHFNLGWFKCFDSAVLPSYIQSEKLEKEKIYFFANLGLFPAA